MCLPSRVYRILPLFFTRQGYISRQELLEISQIIYQCLDVATIQFSAVDFSQDRNNVGMYLNSTILTMNINKPSLLPKSKRTKFGSGRYT